MVAPELADPAKSASWSGIHWKPFEIGIGAFYALCLKGGFDTSLSYFRKNPLRTYRISFHPALPAPQVAIACQLLTFVIWLSAYYFHTVRLFFLLPAEPERDRVIGFANIAFTLGLFYFLAESIGRPSQTQVILIAAVLLVDVLLPFQALKSVATTRMRVWWISVSLAVIAGAVVVILLVPEKMMEEYWWSYLILFLIASNFLVLRPWASRRGFVRQ